MNFDSIYEHILSGQTLSQHEAYELMLKIGENGYSEVQNTALTISLSNRDLVLEELSGFRSALLDLSVPTGITSYDAIDLCGTGGDGKNTFNISTLSSFVVAAAGHKVAKHGNYGVSSVSGSSNILEKLGYRFSTDNDKLRRELDQLNLCFLHAPLFHPALKNVASIRKQLGVKTIFNMLGPLVNPARTKKQFTGVYQLKLARLYHYLLQQDEKEYIVAHSIDGYDEISLTSKVQYFSTQGEYLLSPKDFGMFDLSAENLFGGNTLEETFSIFLKVLKNECTPAQTDVVVANAAAGIQCFEKEKSLQDCVAIARETLESGKANRLLNQLMEIQ